MEYENKRKLLKKEMNDLKKKLETEEKLLEDYKVYFGRESTIFQTQNELRNQIIFTINIIKYILGENHVKNN